MKRGHKVRWGVFLVLIALPIAIAKNCPGAFHNGMDKAHCFVGGGFLMELAFNIQGIIVLSSFMFGLPILLYVGGAFAVGMIAEYQLVEKRAK